MILKKPIVCKRNRSGERLRKAETIIGGAVKHSRVENEREEEKKREKERGRLDYY